MNVIVKNIPNSITCLNLLSGVLAIIFSFRGDSGVGCLTGYELSCVFIGIAAVADFLDGFSARLLGAYSDKGKELDSLSDLVSFGVAPALLLFNMLTDFGAPEWIRYFSLILAAAGGLRLAKFNTDTRQTTSFLGLPIPANAIFWVGYVFLSYGSGGVYFSVYFALAAIVAMSILMTSELKMFSLKFKSYGLKENAERWVLIASAPVFVILLGVGGLMWLIVFYILLSLAIARRLKEKE